MLQWFRNLNASSNEVEIFTFLRYTFKQIILNVGLIHLERCFSVCAETFFIFFRVVLRVISLLYYLNLDFSQL